MKKQTVANLLVALWQEQDNPANSEGDESFDGFLFDLRNLANVDSGEPLLAEDAHEVASELVWGLQTRAETHAQTVGTDESWEVESAYHSAANALDEADPTAL